MIEVTEHRNTVSFLVHVTPRSGRDEIVGERQGALKIRLTSPPVDSRANGALRRFLASALKVPASAVTIVAGEKSRTKRIRVEGITRAAAQALVSGAREA